MSRFLYVALAMVAAFSLASCGTKGRLKTPDQVAADEAKKQRKAEKEALKKAKEEENKEAAPALPANEQK